MKGWGRLAALTLLLGTACTAPYRDPVNPYDPAGPSSYVILSIDEGRWTACRVASNSSTPDYLPTLLASHTLTVQDPATGVDRRVCLKTDFSTLPRPVRIEKAILTGNGISCGFNFSIARLTAPFGSSTIFSSLPASVPAASHSKDWQACGSGCWFCPAADTYFDVTALVKAWLEEGQPNDGFVVSGVAGTGPNSSNSVDLLGLSSYRFLNLAITFHPI